MRETEVQITPPTKMRIRNTGDKNLAFSDQLFRHYPNAPPELRVVLDRILLTAEAESLQVTMANPLAR